MAWSAASATQCTLIAADRGRPEGGIEGSTRPIHLSRLPYSVQSMSVTAQNMGANRHRRHPLQAKPLAPSLLCNDSEKVENGDGIALTVLASRTTGRIPCHATEHRWSGLEIPVV